MDLRKIKKLIELAEASDITELEVRTGDEAVRIVRPSSEAAQQDKPAPAASASPGPAPESPAPAPTPAQAAPPPVAASSTEVRTTIKAPMAGTAYAAPSPGAKPFVQLGAEVAAGDILCIIESMKMMNEIPTARAGRVVEILMADGEPVASGQPLFCIV